MNKFHEKFLKFTWTLFMNYSRTRIHELVPFNVQELFKNVFMNNFGTNFMKTSLQEQFEEFMNIS